MATRVIPTLEPFWESDSNPEIYDRRMAQQTALFQKDVGSAWYGCQQNSEAIIGWCAEHNCPLTRFNLGVAFNELFLDGKLLSRPSDGQQEEEFDLVTFLSPLSARELKALPRGPVKFSDVATHMDSKSTVKLNYVEEDNPMNRRRVAEEYQYLNGLCDIGQDPKKSQLGERHRILLNASRQSQTPSQARLEARQRVIFNHPRVKRDSPEFDRLVNQELENS
jgi:hypothetical protein